MAFKNIKSGLVLTGSLIFLITITFLAPLYHSHNHIGNHHQEYSDDHDLLLDGSGHKGLDANHQHNSSHLHIKKDI